MWCSNASEVLNSSWRARRRGGAVGSTVTTVVVMTDILLPRFFVDKKKRGKMIFNKIGLHYDVLQQVCP